MKKVSVWGIIFVLCAPAAHGMNYWRIKKVFSYLYEQSDRSVESYQGETHDGETLIATAYHFKDYSSYELTTLDEEGWPLDVRDYDARSTFQQLKNYYDGRKRVFR